MKHYTEEQLRAHMADYIKKYFDGNATAFAEYCGISQSYISQALSGTRSIPGPAMDVMGFEWAKKTAVRARRHKE